MIIQYKLALANEDIFLYEDAMEIECDGCRYKCLGRIYFSWFPVFKIKVHLDFDKYVFSMPLFTALLHTENLFSNVKISILGPTKFVINQTETRGSTKGILPNIKIIQQTSKTSVMYFYFANFHPTSTRVHLEFDGWKFILNKVENENEIRGSLSESSGYAITHQGKIERLCQSSFTEDEASYMFNLIDLFMSFCRGLWSSSFLKVGCSRQERFTVIDWDVSCIKIDSYKGRDAGNYSWFNDFLGSRPLIELFPGFCAKWKNDINSLESIVNWYVEANKCSGGIAGSIILIVSALELLSWLILVDGGIISKKDFSDKDNKKYNSTSKKINRLLKEFSIPQDVPECLPNLLTFGKSLKHNVTNGVFVIVEMRNNIVHGAPENRKRHQEAFVKLPDAFGEARELGLLYVELCLLRASNYYGSYVDRVLAKRGCGLPKPVPWLDVSQINID